MDHLTRGHPQAAALIGIAAGTLLNFIGSRYLVFRMAHVRPGSRG
jgi:putative flippase GtrA